MHHVSRSASPTVLGYEGVEASSLIVKMRESRNKAIASCLGFGIALSNGSASGRKGTHTRAAQPRKWGM